jgi:hypothetical protein
MSMVSALSFFFLPILNRISDCFFIYLFVLCVSVSVCQSVCLCTCLSIYSHLNLSINLWIFSSVYPTVSIARLSICLCVHLSAYPSVSVSTCLCILLSVYPSVCVSLCLWILLSVRLSLIYQSDLFSALHPIQLQNCLTQTIWTSTPALMVLFTQQTSRTAFTTVHGMSWHWSQLIFVPLGFTWVTEKSTV